jgi:hypothetical protein
MRKSKRPFWLLLILLSLPLGTYPQEIRRPLSRPATDRLVSALLKSEADGDLKHESTFFRTLHQLARRQGIQPDELTNYDSGENSEGGRARAILTKGRAIALVSGGLEYVIVVLGTNPFSVPCVGNPLLTGASAKAAYRIRFKPTLLSGKAVRVAGVLVYQFNLGEETGRLYRH